MCIKRIILFNFSSGKQLPGIAAAAVIGGKHMKGHGFSKTAGPADTDEFFICIEKRTGMCNQSGFIHIDAGTDCFCKTFVSGI